MHPFATATIGENCVSIRFPFSNGRSLGVGLPGNISSSFLIDFDSLACFLRRHLDPVLRKRKIVWSGMVLLLSTRNSKIQFGCSNINGLLSRLRASDPIAVLILSVLLQALRRSVFRGVSRVGP